MKTSKPKLSDRLFEFAIHSIQLSRKIPITTEYKIIRHQMIKSVTSAGANYEEAQADSSRADFHNKVKIALKEMVESTYWLKILNSILDNSELKKEITSLIDESRQLAKILVSISSKTRE